ncbi:Periplasmic zinc-binding protein TroA precursor [Planctomycetes bacterium Poly30]|uniref:Periplasmic zinc-binding protein TroA n=1 Tax=Saltatorellus ferox TaxID=2528018 RepID=A0A518ELF5_9BACT|nr:Periplasmic zinc-binding protein TroA precursor [Planctomycetes bacterium Poly30]
MPRHLRSAAVHILACLVLLGAWSCRDGSAASATDSGAREPDKKVVVCTTTMIGDIVRAVAGGTAEVHVLFGPTVDPHLFRATRDDVQQLMAADLVFYNGFGLEGYLEPTFRRVAESGIDLVAVAESILKGDEAMQDAGVSDPHVWMDPHLWARTAPLVAEALGRLLPDSAGLPGRAADTNARILALDSFAREAIATIPESARTLVTAHDAFRYFGRRYGLRVEGIQGLSTASEGGLQALESLVDLLVDERIPAVFFESTVSERNVKALIEGAAARGHRVVLGGTLHSDAPGSAGNYEAMMKHNISTIATALRGDSTATEALK